MNVADRIVGAGDRLSPAERRVAEAILAAPPRVAFGTVAQLATRAGTSGPTVLRLAAKLGFDGFAALQAAVQGELADQLRPAAERIRATSATSPLARAAAVEVANVTTTLEGADPAAFDLAVRLLADRRRRVLVLAGEDSAGVAATIAGELDLLRPDVQVVRGSAVAVTRTLALGGGDDVVLAVELRRYERWVLDAARTARGRGASVVAVTDSPLAPLAEGAAAVFVAAAAGAGPFDSHVGILALGNALVAGVAHRLRASATARLDALESAMTDADALTDR